MSAIIQLLTIDKNTLSRRAKLLVSPHINLVNCLLSHLSDIFISSKSSNLYIPLFIILLYYSVNIHGISRDGSYLILLILDY